MIPPNNEIKGLEKDTIGALPVLHSDRLLSKSQLMVDLSFYVTLPIALPIIATIKTISGSAPKRRKT